MTRVRPAVLLLAGALVALPAGALRADDEEPPYDIDQEELESDAPPFKVKRPNDSWVFIDLDAMRERERAAGRDTSGYETLQARLWWGVAKANVFVHAYPYGVNRAEPPTPEELGRPQLEAVQRSLEEAEVKGAGGGRLGRRRAFLFEVEGTNRVSGERVLIMRAITYRPEDNQVFVVSLECAREDMAKDAKKDFAKLLRRIRL